MYNNSVIDGFSFADASDVKIAEQEISRIKYISGKMNMENPEGVLAVYDKLINSGIFVTPIGYEYLRTLQSYLYKCSEIADDAVRDIPIAISYSDALNKRSRDRDEKIMDERSKRTLRKTFKREYKISLIVNVALIIAVIAMFVITLKADNPNMINYRTEIINEYSEWEQSLTQREEAIKVKEKELREFTK